MKKSDYFSSPLVRLWGSNPHLLIQKSELIQIPTTILYNMVREKPPSAIRKVD